MAVCAANGIVSQSGATANGNKGELRGLWACMAGGYISGLGRNGHALPRGARQRPARRRDNQEL